MAIKLSEMVQTGPSKNPPRICVYGPPKIGKTTFASSAKDCVGILTEYGVGDLDFAHVFCPDWQTTKDTVQALILEEHGYKAAFLDSLNLTEHKIWAHVCKEHGKETIEDFGWQRGYDLVLVEWRWLLAKLDELNTKKKMAIILIGHSQIKKFNPPNGESYDRYQLELHDKASSLILKWVDILMFASTVVFNKKSDDGKRTLAGNEGGRVLYTSKSPAYDAGHRNGLPNEIPLSWDAFVQALKEGKKGNAKQA